VREPGRALRSEKLRFVLWRQVAAPIAGDGTRRGRPGAGSRSRGLSIPVHARVRRSSQGNHEFVDLSVGYNHACGRTAGGETYCWGANSQGQVGLGRTNFAQPAPIRVSTEEPLASVAAGLQASCGLTHRGMAMCWGDPYWGGPGPIPGEPPQYFTTPHRVWGAPQLETIALAERHACGIASNGDLWCWGRNGVALGTGNPVQEGLPPVRANGGPWVLVSVRGGSCALDTSSAIWCWGDSQPETGQSLSQRATPTPLPGTRLWRAVSVGGSVACGLTTADGAWCWGANESGQLGTGNTEPVQGLAEVVGGLRFLQLSAGDDTVCGVTHESRLYCWGTNTRDELGNAGLDVEFSATPVEVAAPD
jgi:alpha-tubulin suppressor-like RCC1 family protein